jgi:ABC-type Fe3+ transport system substrate-binding protein
MRDQAAYRACPVSSGRNPENARAFTDFIFSQEARDIFRHFGFLPENRPATPPGP